VTLGSEITRKLMWLLSTFTWLCPCSWVSVVNKGKGLSVRKNRAVKVCRGRERKTPRVLDLGTVWR